MEVHVVGAHYSISWVLCSGAALFFWLVVFLETTFSLGATMATRPNLNAKAVILLTLKLLLF